MATKPEASDLDGRLAQMEATMRQLEHVQSALKSGQWWLQWGGGAAAFVLGTVAAILVAVVVMTLERSFTLADRMADIKSDTSSVATAVSYLRDDVSQIKLDTSALRVDMASVAAAVGAQLDEKKTELLPQ